MHDKWERIIYLVRHGETEYNHRGIIQGRGVDMPLNQTGMEQARRFFEAYRDKGIEIVYYSTLQRTCQTIAPFLEAGYPSVSTPDLDEMDWGIYEGRENTAELQVVFQGFLKAWRNGNLQAGPPGGETPELLRERQLRFLRKLEQSPYRKILVCTHGRAIRSLLCLMLGKSQQNMDDFPHDNLSVYEVVYNQGEYWIRLFNDRSHLNGKN